MNYVVVKFRKSKPDAQVPVKATEGAAGWDLFVQRISGSSCYTGVHVEIPKGYVGLLFPRSSISKTKLWLANSVGVIDSDFRGEIRLEFYAKDWDEVDGYKKGDRCGQLVVIPQPEVFFVEVEQLSETSRGEGGFGSTGRSDLLSTGCEQGAEKEVLLTANPEE